MKPSSIPAILFITFLCINTFQACRQRQSEDDQEGHSSVKATVAVKICPIFQGDAIDAISAYGKTDALRKEKLYSPIAGRVLSLKTLEGAIVKKGDVLAIIQTRESEAAILGAEAMVRTAGSPEQKAEAERVLALARSSQNSINLIAKFDGIVSARAVSEGELVSENSEILTVVDLSTIAFIADVFLREILSVHLGHRALIHFQSLPGKEFLAIVDAINPQTDVQSQTVKVRLHFAAENENIHSLLRTEMVGTIKIITGIRHKALFVPKAALLRDDETNSYSIMIITTDSLALSVPVVMGVVTDTSAEVRGEHLHVGTPVIIEGNYSLEDSTHVIPTP